MLLSTSARRLFTAMTLPSGDASKLLAVMTPLARRLLAEMTRANDDPAGAAAGLIPPRLTLGAAGAQKGLIGRGSTHGKRSSICSRPAWKAWPQSRRARARC